MQVDTYDEFKQKIEEPGGFLRAHWDGTRETEDRIAAETKATIRCIPFDSAKEPGKCMRDGSAVGGAGRVRQGVLIAMESTEFTHRNLIRRRCR